MKHSYIGCGNITITVLSLSIDKGAPKIDYLLGINACSSKASANKNAIIVFAIQTPKYFTHFDELLRSKQNGPKMLRLIVKMTHACGAYL